MEVNINAFLSEEQVHNVALNDYLKALGLYQETLKCQKQVPKPNIAVGNKTMTPNDPVKDLMFSNSSGSYNAAASFQNGKGRKQVT